MSKRLPTLSTAAPWLAFAATLLTYWLTVEPGASLWDCPEYIDSALRLEIGHPPGNPTWLLFHRVVSLLGLTGAGAVLAINLAAGLFTAWSVGLLCAVTQRTLRLVAPTTPSLLPGAALAARTPARDLGALFGALCFGWADSPWFSAVEAEVYAMSLWLTALCVWLALRWLDLRLAASQTASAGLSKVKTDPVSPETASAGLSEVKTNPTGLPKANPDSAQGARLLILIAYLLGLSIGVHQLTLLIIPGLAMIVCYGLLGPQKRARGRQWLAAVLGAVIVAAVLFGLMKGVPRLLAQVELWAVNRCGLPYNAGTLLGWLAVLGVFGLAAFVASHRRRLVPAVTCWCLFFVCLGFSSYALIIVRAAANPPMNQGAPADIFSFITYIDRDQYGGAPLLRGSTPNSRPLKREHISVTDTGDTVRAYYDAFRITDRPLYARLAPGGRISNTLNFLSPQDLARNDSLAAKGGDAYLLTGYKYHKAMVPELEMWFPRLHSSAPADVAAYEDWTGMNANTMERVEITEAADSLGRPVPMLDADGKPVHATELRPTYLQNLAMLLGYQSGYMYFRYLLWNFSGRQNDVHSTGEVEHGNFITGLTPLDNLMLGAEDQLPDSIGRDNPGRNRYFMIPLLLGLLGLGWLCCQGQCGRRVAGVSAVLFLMTGLAIVLYLNQTPGEPRERDYSFLGSFWVFAFWIAAGMYALTLWVRSLINKRADSRARAERQPKGKPATQRLINGTVLTLMACVPLWMLAENFDDHDRSGRYPADEYAGMVLESLPENTILFTTGDNHTFPLWYARNARGVRRDVTVVNTSYLQLPLQVLQLMSADENGRKVNMTMRPQDIVYGGVATVRVGRDTTLMDAVEALRRLYADTTKVPVLPTTRLLIGGREPVIFDLTERYGIRPGGLMTLRQLAMLDIVATNALSAEPRPIAWHRILTSRAHYGWTPYLTPTPFADLWDPNPVEAAPCTPEGYTPTADLQHPNSLTPTSKKPRQQVCRKVKNPNSLTPTAEKPRQQVCRKVKKANRYAQESRRRLLATRPKGTPGHRYIDPVYGDLITYQRLCLLTEARRALQAGDTLSATALLTLTHDRYPFSEWAPQTKAFCGEILNEADLFTDLAVPLHRYQALTDTLRAHTTRTRHQWHRYRSALPSRLRQALTPTDRHLSTP